MKKTAYGIMALMILSVATAAFVLADESFTVEDSIVVETTDNVTEVIETPLSDVETVAEVTAETEALAPDVQAPADKQRFAGIFRTTVGDGFVVSTDNKNAEKFRGFWISSRYVSIDTVVVRNLTKQYRGEPEKLRAELGKLITDDVVVKATGRFGLGYGANSERYKLVKKSFSNTTVNFYVFPNTENLGALRNLTEEEISAKSIGILTADATKYPHLTTWKGTLKLNAGKFVGTWVLTASSHSRVVSKAAVVNAKDRAKKAIEKLQERPEIANKTANAVQPVKRGLLARIFGFNRQQ